MHRNLVYYFKYREILINGSRYINNCTVKKTLQIILTKMNKASYIPTINMVAIGSKEITKIYFL